MTQIRRFQNISKGLSNDQGRLMLFANLCNLRNLRTTSFSMTDENGDGRF